MLQLLSVKNDLLSNRFCHPLNIEEYVIPVLIGLSVISVGLSGVICAAIALPLALGTLISLSCITSLKLELFEKNKSSDVTRSPEETPPQVNLRRQSPQSQYWNGSTLGLGNGRRLRFYLSSSSGVESEADAD